MSEFNLPDVGEGLTEAEIVTWRVKVGDDISVNDIIVDIETAKSIVELPSPYEGTVTALLVAEGETVEVGTPIIQVTGADEEAVVPAPPAAASGEAPAEERNPVLVGYGPRTTSVKRRARKASVSSVDTAKVAQRPAPVAPLTAAAVVKQSRPTRVLAKPPVRKFAKDLGVDLHLVPSAGDIITRADVEAFALRHNDGGPERSIPMTQGPTAAGDVRIPIKGVRKMTAEAMVSSAFTAPHVTEWITIDVTKTMDLVGALKKNKAFADVKVSPLLIVAKAVCLAIKRTPEVNSSWDEAAQEIVLKGSVNLGIAAATPRGLVVPNVVGAEQMTLLQLAEALGELTRTARDGKTQPAQMAGGSFTITNVGVFGVDAGTPILNPGEAGILAMGAINKRPWVDEDGELVVRDVTTLALSFDHRLVDGAQGSVFLADVAAILADPAMALTF